MNGRTSQSNVARLIATLMSVAVVVISLIFPRLVARSNAQLLNYEEELVGSWQYACPDHIHFGADKTWKSTTINRFELANGEWTVSEDGLLRIKDNRVRPGGDSEFSAIPHLLDNGRFRLVGNGLAEVDTGTNRWVLIRADSAQK